MSWFFKKYFDRWMDRWWVNFKRLEMVQTIIKVLQRCHRELPWSQSRRWRDRSICKLWAACLHLWRSVCDFPRTAWGGTRHVDLHGNETVGWERPSKRTRLTWMLVCPEISQLTRKLAPIRRDPVPEMVWTVMLCWERRLASPIWA